MGRDSSLSCSEFHQCTKYCNTFGVDTRRHIQECNNCSEWGESIFKCMHIARDVALSSACKWHTFSFGHELAFARHKYEVACGVVVLIVTVDYITSPRHVSLPSPLCVSMTETCRHSPTSPDPDVISKKKMEEKTFFSKKIDHVLCYV